METMIPLRTVRDLRTLIDGTKYLSGDVEIHFFDGDTVFELEAEVGVRDCCEHNGKKHVKAGLIFEVDDSFKSHF